MKHNVPMTLAFSILILLGACGGGGIAPGAGGGAGVGLPGDPPPPVEEVFEGFFLSPSPSTVAPGQTVQITASEPATFELDPQSPGTLSAEGVYTAPASGTAVAHIFATCKADPTLRSMVDVHVRTGKAQEPFFAPPASTGTVKVKLHPTEGVATGTPVLVTFGMPFPRGSIDAANLASLRVLNSLGAEIPAYVVEQTPWRHYVDTAIDGTWVRVAQIQIHHTFSATYPEYEEISVTWGIEARTKDVSTRIDPRSAWHVCASGTFVAADGISEPDVYAVLPADWLARGVLSGRRTLPLASAVTEARDDPRVMGATQHWPEYTELDYASKNFFYTSINEDDSRVVPANQVPYKTKSEPWLFDRAATFYQLYFRSGFFRVLREAVRAAEFYKKNLYPAGTTPESAVGIFKLKSSNPKAYIGPNGAMYSYTECLAYTYWLTGDDAMLEGARWVMSALQHESNIEGELTRWSPTLPAWTERHTGLRLLGTIVAYELFGDEAYADAVQSQISDYRYNQDGAGGDVPNPHIDGAMWHKLSQHEGTEASKLIASAWMTVLVVDAMVRAYGLSEDPGIADFVRRTGTFFGAAAKLVPPSLYEYDEDVKEVDYLTFIDGTTVPGDDTTGEHTLDVAGATAWASYFADLADKPDPSLRLLADALYLTFDVSVNYWTRPDAPPLGYAAFRLAPTRKYSWMYRTSSSLSWILKD